MTVCTINKSDFTCFIKLFSVIILFLGAEAALSRGLHSVANGHLDLTSWNGDQAVILNGDWRFVANRLVSPDEFLNDPGDLFRELKPVPGRHLGDETGGVTHASYLLKVKRSNLHNVGLQFNQFQTNFRLFVFSRNSPVVEASNGVVSSNPNEVVESIHSSIVDLSQVSAENSEIYFLLQVSNSWFGEVGGVFQAPSLENIELLKRKELVRFSETIFLFGAFALMAVTNLSLFLQRREDKASLLISLFSFLMGVRYLATEGIFSIFFDSSSFFNFSFSYYIIANMLQLGMGLYLGFLALSFENVYSRKVLKYLYLAQLISHAWILFRPIDHLSGIGVFYNLLFIVVMGGYLVYGLFRAWKKALKGVKLASSGILVLILGFTNDSLMATGVYDWVYIAHYSLVLFVLIQSNITGRIFAETFRAAERYAQELVEKEKARTLFFHNTSHELRTPLNGIIGFLDLVCQGRYGDLTRDAKAQISKALRLAESLKIQVNTILDLAKSKRGELVVHPQNFSLSELRKEADGLAEGLCLKSGDLSYESDFDVMDENFISDQEKVFTIIRNLLGNAFKFRKPGAKHLVKLSIHQDEKILSITVKDTGIGIPSEQRDKIFEEFGQVESDARRAYEGTGLGLSMVKNLVDLLGGQIELISEVDQGSSFRVILPALPLDSISTATNETDDRVYLSEAEPLREGNREHSTSFELTQDCFDILVVDDNETNCEVISEILKADGHRVHSALSGRIGLELMRTQKPDLLLLDMMMPEMSGQDVLTALKLDSLLQDIPVILITARASEEDRVLGLRLGVDDYLPKPIFAPELRLRVHNLLKRTSLVRQVERASQDDKFTQLGSLFGELSHELKNVIAGVSNLQGTDSQDANIVSRKLALDNKYKALFAKGLMESYDGSDRDERLERLESGVEDENFQKRWALRFELSEFNLNQEDLVSLWDKIKVLPKEELEYAATQVKLFSEHRVLMEQTKMAKEITSSVLNYTRSDTSHSSTCLDKAWQDVSRLLQNKQRKLNAKIEANFEAIYVPIGYASMMQVLLNLVSNALDAVAELETHERWVQLSFENDACFTSISVENAGKPIAKSTAEKLFDRGFSTKGDKGNGIGLFVSRRLVTQAGGELFYDLDCEHPRFVVKLPLEADDVGGVASSIEELVRQTG